MNTKHTINHAKMRIRRTKAFFQSIEREITWATGDPVLNYFRHNGGCISK